MKIHYYLNHSGRAIAHFFFRFRPLAKSNCIADIDEVRFEHEGKFHMNTSMMELYTDYFYKVIVTKEGRNQQEFQQKIVVKEGDPPDFFIK